MLTQGIIVGLIYRNYLTGSTAGNQRLYNFIRETLIPRTPFLSKEMINSIK